jgi:hypothetical protein
MVKRAARSGPARAWWSPTKNRAGPAEPAGLIFCPSLAAAGLNGPGSTKKRGEKRAKRTDKHVLV